MVLSADQHLSRLLVWREEPYYFLWPLLFSDPRRTMHGFPMDQKPVWRRAQRGVQKWL